MSTGVLAAQDYPYLEEGFRTYPKAERPKGPMHNAFAPLRDGLFGDLERLRARPQELLESVGRTLDELRGIGALEQDPEGRAFRAEALRLRGTLRMLIGAQRANVRDEENGRRDIGRARSLYRELLEEEGWRFTAVIGIGRCEESLGRRIEALKQLGEAARLDPYSEEPWLEKARIYRESGEPGQARLEILAGLERLPGEIHLELERLGLDVVAGGDHFERFGAFVRVVRDAPDAGLRSRLALHMVQQGVLLARRDDPEKKDAERSLGLLVEATEMDAANGDAWYFRAEATTRAGFPFFIEAIDYFENATRNRTRYFDDAHLEQAKLIAVVYGQLLERDRGQALDWMRRAQDYRDELDRREVSLEGLDSALVDCFKEDSTRGQEAFAEERWEEALKSFELARVADPTNAWVSTYRGMCLEELERFENASEAFGEAVEIALARRQDVWLPFVELSEKARSAGRLEDAKAFAMRYLEAFPEGERAEWFRERYR